MAAKFQLVAAPTFKAKVEIPVHGGSTVPVEFEFKHRTREEMDNFYSAAAERTVEQSILESAVGWELEDPFNEESIKTLCENYWGAPAAISQAYLEALLQAKLGN